MGFTRMLEYFWVLSKVLDSIESVSMSFTVVAFPLGPEEINTHRERLFMRQIKREAEICNWLSGTVSVARRRPLDAIQH